MLAIFINRHYRKHWHSRFKYRIKNRQPVLWVHVQQQSIITKAYFAPHGGTGDDDLDRLIVTFIEQAYASGQALQVPPIPAHSSNPLPFRLRLPR